MQIEGNNHSVCLVSFQNGNSNFKTRLRVITRPAMRTVNIQVAGKTGGIEQVSYPDPRDRFQRRSKLARPGFQSRLGRQV